MILDERGLSALVITFHPAAWWIASSVASVGTVILWWFWGRRAHGARGLWTLLFFLGSALLSYSTLTHQIGVAPLSLETIEVWGDDLKPKPARPVD